MLILQTLSLLLPILVAGVFLIVVIKRKMFPGLDRPIDGGVKFRGEPLFGKNKKWRGVVIYIIGSVVVCTLLWLGGRRGFAWVHPIFLNNPLILGLLYGISYSAGELVNSFIKRRLGIKPGKSVNGLQYTFDTIDGMVFAIIVLSIVYGANWFQLLLVLVIGSSLHLATDVVMRRYRLKK